MEKKGYPRDFSTAVTVSGSVQAILIPPSHNAVIYSLAAGGSVSIAALFMAGVLPGLLLGLTLAVLCLIIAKQARLSRRARSIPLRRGAEDLRRCAVGPDDDGHHPRRHPVRRVHRHRVGRRSPCVWAFFVTMFIYRDYKWSDLPKLMHRTVKTVTIVMILIGFAAGFGYMMTLMQIPPKITRVLRSVCRTTAT